MFDFFKGIIKEGKCADIVEVFIRQMIVECAFIASFRKALEVDESRVPDDIHPGGAKILAYSYLLTRNSLTYLNPQQSQNLMQEAKDDAECLGLEKVFELMIRPLDAVMLRIDALLLQCLPEMF